MDSTETIHDRIKLLVDKFGDGKNTSFASLIGTNEANIRGYTKGIMPKFDFLEKIARSIDINLDWLLTGRGNMLNNIQTITQKDSEPIMTNNGEAIAYYKMYKEKATEVIFLAEEIGRLKELVNSLKKTHEHELNALKNEISNLTAKITLTNKPYSSSQNVECAKVVDAPIK